jgi:hypothetical protein
MEARKTLEMKQIWRYDAGYSKGIQNFILSPEQTASISPREEDIVFGFERGASEEHAALSSPECQSVASIPEQPWPLDPGGKVNAAERRNIAISPEIEDSGSTKNDGKCPSNDSPAKC